MSYGLGKPTAILLPAYQKLLEYAHGKGGRGGIMGEDLF